MLRHPEEWGWDMQVQELMPSLETNIILMKQRLDSPPTHLPNLTTYAYQLEHMVHDLPGE